MQDSNPLLLMWLDKFIITSRLVGNQVCQSRFGMDIDHTRLLRIITDNPNKSVNWVVAESYLDRTFVSRAISKFVKLKLVERTISSNDARQFCLKITPAGLKLVKEANKMREIMELEVLSVLNDEERKNFEQCLAKLAQWAPKDFDRFKKTKKQPKVV